jgi:hypothetical protein
MAVTKRHLVSDLLELSRAGRGSDDEPLTPELVGFWVDNTRATLIGQWIDKGRSINPELVQTIPCMEVQAVDASECGCETTGCLVFRTVEQVPSSIESSKGLNLITRVAPTSITSTSFSFMPFERAIWSGGSVFTKNIPKAFLRNGYIYILSNNFIGEKISVSLVASYPEDLQNFATCSGATCYTDDSPYPISSRMIEVMKGLIKENNLNFVLQVKGDDVNNANGIV